MITVLVVFALVIGIVVVVFQVGDELARQRRRKREQLLVDKLYILVESAKTDRPPESTIREIQEHLGTVSLATCATHPEIREKMYAVRNWLAAHRVDSGTREKVQVSRKVAAQRAIYEKEKRIWLKHVAMNIPPDISRDISSFWFIEAVRSGWIKIIGEILQFTFQFSDFVKGNAQPTLYPVEVSIGQMPPDVRQGLQATEAGLANLRRAANQKGGMA